MTIDTTNMCSHLQRKLFEEDGIYHSLWIAMQDDPDLKRGVLSEDGIWNLLSDYREIQKNFVKLGTKMRIIK